MIDKLDVEQMMMKFLDDVDPLNNETKQEESMPTSHSTLLTKVKKQSNLNNHSNDSIETNEVMVALESSDSNKGKPLLRTSSRGKGSSKKEEDDLQVASKPLTRRQRKKLEQQELLRESIRVREESQIICKMEREHKRPGDDSNDETLRLESQNTSVHNHQTGPPGDDWNELKSVTKSTEIPRSEIRMDSSANAFLNIDANDLEPTDVFEKSPLPGSETSIKADILKAEVDASKHPDCSLFKAMTDSSIIDDLVSHCISDNPGQLFFNSQQLFLDGLTSPAELNSDVSDDTLSDLSHLNDALSINTLCKLLEPELASEISLEGAEASVDHGLKMLQALSDNFYTCLNRSRHIVFHK